MNHLDNVLKRYANPVDEAEDKARASYFDDLQTEARQIQELMQSPGWHHFVAIKKEQENTILRALELAESPTSQARLVGHLIVVKSDQSWAEDRLRDLELALADVNDAQ